MKALFVSPGFPITCWGFDCALALVGKCPAYPALGLLTVPALLPRFWERRPVDMKIRPLRESDIAWADLVLVGACSCKRTSYDRSSLAVRPSESTSPSAVRT